MRLSIRAQRMMIYTASASCLLLTGAIVAWAMHSTRLPAKVHGSNGEVSQTVAQGGSATELRKEDFNLLCEIQLRRPLYDPPPPTPEVRQLPPLGIQLLGTILEGDNSIAMIRSEQGKTEYRRRGESVGPVDSAATIVEIQGDAIVLDRQSERLTLRVMGSDQR